MRATEPVHVPFFFILRPTLYIFIQRCLQGWFALLHLFKATLLNPHNRFASW